MLYTKFALEISVNLAEMNENSLSDEKKIENGINQ